MMLSVIIPNTEEDTVIQLTYENLRRELASVERAELLIDSSWERGIERSVGDYICFVEPDCLISGGYFSSNLNLFRKNSHFRKLAMVGSCIGVNNWGNRIYNYKLKQLRESDKKLSLRYWRIAAEREKVSSTLYPVQVAFAPGAIFRRSALVDAMKHVGLRIHNTVELSTRISFYLWSTNRRVLINPNTTYVSTDKTLEDPTKFSPKTPRIAANIFEKEGL